MSILAEALGLIFELLDNPSSDILDVPKTCVYLFQVLALKSQKLTSTGNGLRERASPPYQPQAKEFPLSSVVDTSAQQTVLFVERQIDSTQDVWLKVETVDVSNLARAEEQGEFAVAIYGVGQEITCRLSWRPQDLPQDSLLKFWYAPDVTLPTTKEGELEFPSAFTSLLAAETIILLGPYLLKKAKGDADLVAFVNATLTTQVAYVRDFNEQFEIHRLTTKDTGSGVVAPFGAARRGGYWPLQRRLG